MYCAVQLAAREGERDAGGAVRGGDEQDENAAESEKALKHVELRSAEGL